MDSPAPKFKGTKLTQVPKFGDVTKTVQFSAEEDGDYEFMLNCQNCPNGSQVMLWADHSPFTPIFIDWSTITQVNQSFSVRSSVPSGFSCDISYSYKGPQTQGLSVDLQILLLQPLKNSIRKSGSVEIMHDLEEKPGEKGLFWRNCVFNPPKTVLPALILFDLQCLNCPKGFEVRVIAHDEGPNPHIDTEWISSTGASPWSVPIKSHIPANYSTNISYYIKDNGIKWPLGTSFSLNYYKLKDITSGDSKLTI